MSFVYTEAARAIAAKEIDFDSDTFKIILCMANTDAVARRDDANFVDDIALDECDGANYARVTLLNPTITENPSQHRAQFKPDDLLPAWALLGAGTRNNIGIVLMKFVTNDTDSVPVAWYDDAATGFPFNGTGGDKDLTWSAQGAIQFQC
jgi:hypothetical protein